ncbi:MAG: hypothetical protein J5I41_11960 [Saprospiraceae bacterium]|nr:hypothetical protein [Saprospiraceae bacterium]
MNPTHIHLVITHLPIYGAFLGALVLVWGLLSRSVPTKVAAYGVLLIASLGAVIAFQTGEEAEETAERIAGISKTALEAHEHFADNAYVAFIVLGVASLLAMWITYRHARLARTVAWLMLVIAMVAFGLAARTGYLGGQIRHTEIQSPPPAGVHHED